jgi:hypothetical protein
MRSVGNVMRVAETSGAFVVWWENLRETDHLEDLGVDGRIILKSIFKKYERRRTWARLIWPRIGTNSGLLLTL